MTSLLGNLRKMKSEACAPIHYYLRLNNHEVCLNEHIGKSLRLTHTGNIYCIQCGRKTRKSFQQGFCFPCLKRLHECHLCIIYPERCQIEKGKCPKDDWAHSQCHQTHIIYLANSSGLKVGITREAQILTRWIDQGALMGLPLFKAANRYQAGALEVALKAFVNDRTHWQRMLKNDVKPLNLIEAAETLQHHAAREIDTVMGSFSAGDIVALANETVTKLTYPVQKYPEKINALSFDVSKTVSGVLWGIKGQYLILDTGVLNIRKFGGYEIECFLWTN